MSFLYDPVASTSRLFLGAAENGAKKGLRKSKSHAGFLSPLIHLVRDPVGTIGGVIFEDGPLGIAVGDAEAEEGRRQVLYLRMRNVSLCVPFVAYQEREADRIKRLKATTTGDPPPRNSTSLKAMTLGSSNRNRPNTMPPSSKRGCSNWTTLV
jgi:hypothetical protein